MKTTRRIFTQSAAAVLTGAFLAPGAVLATQSQPNPQDVSYIAVDSNGRIYNQHNANQPGIPASIVKTMTGLLMIKGMQDFRLDWHEPIIELTKKTFGKDERLFPFAEPTNKIPPLLALNSLMLCSGNNAAVSIAETVAEWYTGQRNEAIFVQMMNDQARIEGMRHTSFQDSYGIYDQKPITTATDMNILGHAFYNLFPVCDELPNMESLTGQERFFYKGQPQENTNRLVQPHDFRDTMRRLNIDPSSVHFDIIGLKTGRLNAAGHCLLAVAHLDLPARNKTEKLFITYFGGKSAVLRNMDVFQLFYDTQNKIMQNIRPQQVLSQIHKRQERVRTQAFRIS